MSESRSRFHSRTGSWARPLVACGLALCVIAGAFGLLRSPSVAALAEELGAKRVLPARFLGPPAAPPLDPARRAIAAAESSPDVGFAPLDLRLATTQLGMVIDGSGSINDIEWGVMVDGLAAAIENPDCFPQDGSVELSVIQFSEDARVEIVPTVLTSANVSAVADDIRDFDKMGSTTCVACGIALAADTMAASPEFNPTLKQAINLVTDGVPNDCYDIGDGDYRGNDCPDCDSGGCAEAYDSSVAARDYLIATLAMTQDQDKLDAEGIGITDANKNWLRDDMVWPQPGAEWDPPSPVPPLGWVRRVGNFQEFADTVCEKLQAVLEPSTPELAIDKQLTGQDTGAYEHADLEFAIVVSNVGPNAIDILPLDDVYDPYYLSFVDATPYPEEDADDGRLTWYDLTRAPPHGFGADLAPGEAFTVTTVFTVAHDIVTTVNTAVTGGAVDIYGTTVPEVEDEIVVRDTPTAIGLLDFRIDEVTGREVTVGWATVVELNTLGFNLYRAPHRDWARAELVAWVPAGGHGIGRAYLHVDTVPADGGWWYWLGTIDGSGRETVYGPVRSAVGASVGRWRVYLPTVLKP